MKIKRNNLIKIITAVILSGAILYFSNLYWLAQVNRPALRGNHVGLSFLCVLVFWGLFLLVNWFLRARNKES